MHRCREWSVRLERHKIHQSLGTNCKLFTLITLINYTTVFVRCISLFDFCTILKLHVNKDGLHRVSCMQTFVEGGITLVTRLPVMCKNERTVSFCKSETIFLALILSFKSFFHRHQVQHYSNQLAKETNKYIKDMAALPHSSIQSEQV